MTVYEIYDQSIKSLPADDRLRLAKLIIDDLSSDPEDLRAFDSVPSLAQQSGDFGGRSLADLMNEIGFAEGGPSDLSQYPEKYMKGFGETKTS